jgi:hypothetical protein
MVWNPLLQKQVSGCSGCSFQKHVRGRPFLDGVGSQTHWSLGGFMGSSTVNRSVFPG